MKEILTRYRVVDLPTAQAPRGPQGQSLGWSSTTPSLTDGALLLPHLNMKEILTRYRVVDLPTAQAPRGPHVCICRHK